MSNQNRPGPSSGKRQAGDRGNSSPAKVNKSLLVCCMTGSGYFMSLILVISINTCSAQNVIFSNKKMSFHAERHVLNARVVKTEISRTIEMILHTTDSTDFEQLGDSLTEHLETMLKDYLNDYNALFNIHDDKLREKKGFRWLGNLASSLFETASPDDWSHQKEIDKNLLTVTKNLNSNMKINKKAIKHVNSKIDNAIKILQSQTLYIGNMTNEIEHNQNNTMVLSHALILHTRANDLLSHAIREIYVLESILNKAELDLPSRFMFPIKTIKKTIRENLENEKNSL